MNSITVIAVENNSGKSILNKAHIDNFDLVVVAAKNATDVELRG
jgi:Trk K+ transport system NAD-binding subunit